MAPARSTNRRGQRDQNTQPQPPSAEPVSQVGNDTLFFDLMLGTPLALYVEKDVPNRDAVVELISKHGGVVSPGYSGVTYILVDPHRESGQNLYRQYVGKKNKIILDASWIYACIKAGSLQTFRQNWAGCKVTGSETVTPTNTAMPTPQPAPPPGPSNPPLVQSSMVHQMPPPPMMHPHPSQMQPPMGVPPPEALAHHPQAYPYPVYPPHMHPPGAGPPQSWQAASAMPPQHMPPPQAPQAQQHMMQQHPQDFRDGQGWANGYHQPQASTSAIPPPAYGYERYSQEQAAWAPPGGEYYHHPPHPPPYEPQPPPPAPQQSYPEQDAYMEDAEASTAGDPSASDPSEKPRGRKRVRTQPQPAPPASTLVVNRRNPPARSPTPPNRVIKSTYGGNLFTVDDVMYLKKYIDYCQEQGLVLSLREICERVAIKAPHHTFYSWRRYCNKHKIRLGGYAMDLPDGDATPVHDEGPVEGPIEPEHEIEGAGPSATTGPGAIEAARRAAAADIGRTRSPTPPRALFRSTTGKGVAFTDEDVAFLVRYLEYRGRQNDGKVDMVAFWKDVAAKAPHHSRASWMKFYRRHKHELHHSEGDAPLPAPPEKKMRYSRADDVLLAKYFVNKPDGTSDKIFQAFGRLHPHHPWKGWQEHHRIHKATIDRLIARLEGGESIDDEAIEISNAAPS